MIKDEFYEKVDQYADPVAKFLGGIIRGVVDLASPVIDEAGKGVGGIIGTTINSLFSKLFGTSFNSFSGIVGFAAVVVIAICFYGGVAVVVPIITSIGSSKLGTTQPVNSNNPGMIAWLFNGVLTLFKYIQGKTLSVIGTYKKEDNLKGIQYNQTNISGPNITPTNQSITPTNLFSIQSNSSGPNIPPTNQSITPTNPFSIQSNSSGPNIPPTNQSNSSGPNIKPNNQSNSSGPKIIPTYQSNITTSNQSSTQDIVEIPHNQLLNLFAKFIGPNKSNKNNNTTLKNRVKKYIENITAKIK